MKPTVLFIVGPTGSGKTEVSIRLAKRLRGEIISADSMLVYRDLNVGTAKPTRREQRGVAHHLMNLVGPRSRFSVEKYRKLAFGKLEDIVKRKKIPIVVGGSGLYVQALIDGLAPHESNSSQIRKRLESEVSRKGLGVLYEQLKQIDPSRAREILPSDERRIIRALEIYEVTGDLPSSWREKKVSLDQMGYQWILIGLRRDRTELYQRVNGRVDQMLKRGLIAEVKRVMKKGLSRTAKQAIGYREFIEHLRGAISLDDAINLMKQRSRNLAKKQLTWFRKESRIQWIDVSGHDYKAAMSSILRIVKNYA